MCVVIVVVIVVVIGRFCLLIETNLGLFNKMDSRRENT